MTDLAIRVENLGKQFKLGRLQTRHDTLRDALAARVESLLIRSQIANRKSSNGNTPSANPAQPSEYIWALRDVSFEVKRGEVVGIIGRNGAGKSTLLKILSRITEPTTGEIDIYGRVGSLLEVGTGFHPELTGRENIFLNGAILGMKRAEIERRFDEIVAFSEVEKFIDTPVKRYSSGMYVRLAFAVAAHLEPEILLVDEVLAVGDAAFQKKCLGKMGDVAKEGRTVLFVSHNMAAVGRLCTNAFWLDQGQVAHSGTAQSVIRAYLASSESQEGYVEWADVTRAPGDEFMRALSVSILDMQGTRTTELHQDLPFVIRIEYRVLKPMMNANVGFELRADEGTVVFSSFDADSPEWSGRGRSEGVYVAQCIVPAHLLNEGAYYLTLYAGIPHIRVCVRAEDILRLDIKPPLSGKGPTARMGARRAGVISPELEWHISAPERVLEAHIALQ